MRDVWRSGRVSRVSTGASVASVDGVLPRFRHSTSDQDGFTVIELMGALLVMSIVIAMGIGNFSAALNTVRGDGSMNVVLWQLKLARETAINQRRDVEVRFTMPNFISVVRRNLPNGETVISTAVLQSQSQFRLFAGIPDTPDSFGRNAAIDFGAATAYMFTPDGQVIDQTGNVINGSIFIGQINTPVTARALTVFGPTAGIRAYRWNGTQWRH